MMVRDFPDGTFPQVSANLHGTPQEVIKIGVVLGLYKVYGF